MSEAKVLYVSTDEDGNRHTINSVGEYWVHAEGANEPIIILRSAMVARLAARVRELEAENEALKAAVQWAIKENSYSFFDTAEDVIGSMRADFAVDRWFASHPIVRSVVEKGGE